MKASLTDIASIILNEFKTIAGSFAIVLVLMGGIFMYGILYNYMYAPDLVRNVPVVVVDNSKTGLSREYIRLLNATPQVDVIATGEDFPQAKELLKMNEAAGILYLPDDFTDRVSRGDEFVFIMYETTDAFLYYLAMQEASASSMLALNADYRPSMAVFLPAGDVAQLSATQPINVAGTALYNYTKGYGAYLIPAVLIVIMFQTLPMVIGMVIGDERQYKLLRNLRPSFAQAMHLVAGKTFVYLVLYAIFAFFLLGADSFYLRSSQHRQYLEYHHATDPFPALDGFFRAHRFRILLRLRRAPVDDRFLLRRADLPFRRILSAGADALVLETVAFSDPCRSRRPCLRKTQFDGGFDGRDTCRIYHPVGAMCRLFLPCLPGLSI